MLFRVVGAGRSAYGRLVNDLRATLTGVDSRQCASPVESPDVATRQSGVIDVGALDRELINFRPPRRVGSGGWVVAVACLFGLLAVIATIFNGPPAQRMRRPHQARRLSPHLSSQPAGPSQPDVRPVPGARHKRTPRLARVLRAQHRLRRSRARPAPSPAREAPQPIASPGRAAAGTGPFLYLGR